MRQFKTQASSSRAPLKTAFGGFDRSKLSYAAAELPDLSAITDPNIVVAFKNVSKADATTKTKALDVLEDYVVKQGGVEDPILEAWVKSYPRLSINNNRRVREQSHDLQVKLLKSARKRMERYLPETVGSWLAGCYDKDGFVARAAQNGVNSFLDTDSKATAFWTRCQAQILDYALEAINETTDTLSDERNTNADDAQALYLRVMGSSMSLMSNLLFRLKQADIVKYQDKYEDFLRSKKLWAFASSDDSFIRRTLYNLLIVCLEKQPDAIKSSLDMISRGLIVKGLSVSQSSSSLQLLQALGKLTARFPEAWTSAYPGTGSSFNRLREFVKKGSQGSPVDYWTSLQDLFPNLPPGVLPADTQMCLKFLTEFRDSIQGREQPRQHAEQAWSSYFSVFGILIRNSSDTDFQTTLFRDEMYPIFDRYLQGEQERNLVTAPAMAKAYAIWALDKSPGQDILSIFLQKLAGAFIARSLTSIHVTPEDSEAYKLGQRKVIAEGHRWFALLAEILKSNDCEKEAQSMILSSLGIFNSALRTIVSEDGRPYSAAAVVEIALRLTPTVVETSPEMLKSVTSLIENQIPQIKFISSPSSRHLVSILYLFRSLTDQELVFEKAWMSSVISLLPLSSAPGTLRLLEFLLANDGVSKLSQSSSGLQTVLLETNLRAMDGEEEAWSLFETAVTFNSYAESSASTLVNQIVGCLNPKDRDSPPGSERSERAFQTLEFISRHNPHLLSQGKENHIVLTTMLLEITEISDRDVASRALALKTAIEKANQITEKKDQASILDLVRWNLELEPTSSRILLIETLVQQAKDFKSTTESSAPIAAFLPDPEKWSKALVQTLSISPNPALGVMRPFAGINLYSASLPVGHVQSVDLRSFPIALRMAMYTSNFVDDLQMLLQLPTNRLVEILHSLLLTAHIVSDQLDLVVVGRSPDWAIDNEDEMEELRNLASSDHLASLRNEAKKWQQPRLLQKIAGNDYSVIVQALISKLLETASAGPGQYYGAKALGHLTASLVDAHGWDVVSGETWLSELNILKPNTTNILGATALLIGLETSVAPSKIVNSFCNHLISDIAGATAASDKTLGQIVLLNAVLPVYREDGLPVAKNRLIFATKQILSWTDDLASTDPKLSSEVCRALQLLLPALNDVYGTYWETTLGFCRSIWESNPQGELTEQHLPMTGMSLKLYSTLRNLQEPNDDLIEALADQREYVSQALVGLLKLRRIRENQPLEFVDNLLLRQLRNVPREYLYDLSEIYPLLASENRNMQSAAYDLIHRALTHTQQQISVDVLLEGNSARLPDELLSLLLDPPSMDDHSDETLQEFPTAIRGYLLSWHLVYECYSNASLKVRNDYSDLLRTENYIAPLLGLLFDLLGTFSGNSIDSGKFNFDWSTISKYDMWIAIDSESPKRDLSWLLANISYVCLKFTPNLTRNWWLDCKSKQTKIVARKWTEKFLSPLLVTEVKDEVSKWADEQDTSDDKKTLVIKTSKNSPEIQAGYEVDEFMMQIVVTLPSDYPLQGVEVRGLNRVAVNEKTWRSWQMITQGVMRINNVVDGLILFRDNASLALAGKTECAICYSILGPDKRMPDKRCGTCKNLFHGNCLFKWFQSSNQSSCPLCRKPFTYGAHATHAMGNAL